MFTCILSSLSSQNLNLPEPTYTCTTAKIFPPSFCNVDGFLGAKEYLEAWTLKIFLNLAFVVPSPCSPILACTLSIWAVCLSSLWFSAYRPLFTHTHLSFKIQVIEYHSKSCFGWLDGVPNTLTENNSYEGLPDSMHTCRLILKSNVLHPKHRGDLQP